MNERRPAPKRRTTRPESAQPKFDRWLLQMKDEKVIVGLVLDPSPYEVDTLNVVPARIVEVDRYFICVQFQDHRGLEDDMKRTYSDITFWWIPKDSIKGASSQAPMQLEHVQ